MTPAPRHLALAQESVELSRMLADSDPDTYLPQLAHALGNQYSVLVRAGRADEALAAVEEAIAAWRRVPGPGRVADRLAYASLLTDYSDMLAATGGHTEGLAAAEEAMDVLAGSDMTDRTQAAAVTGTYGERLAAVGRHAEALDAARKAVALRRALAGSAAGDRRLATELRRLSVAYHRLGQHDEARVAIEEAIARLHTSGERGPALADALRLLGTLLAHYPDRIAEALTRTEEAVEIRRECHRADPDRHRSGLAADLLCLSHRLAALGRMTDAVPIATEAQHVAHALSAAVPNLRYFQLALDTSLELVMLSVELRRDLPEALDTLDEMDRMLDQPLARHVRDRDFAHDVLVFRAHVLTGLGRAAEAREVTRARLAAERHDTTLHHALDSTRHPIRRLLDAVVDLGEFDHPRAPEALASIAITSPRGSTLRAAAQRLLRRHARHQERTARKPVATAGPSRPTTPRTPPAASLLADTLAAEALDAEASSTSRLAAARQLHTIGDPRGLDLLVALTQDRGIARFARRQAADLLVKLGDPRGRFLAADLYAEEATDPGAGRLRRALALAGLDQLDEARAARLRAGVDVDPVDQRFGWPQTAPTPLPDGVLRNVGPDVAAAVTRLAAVRAPRRARRYGWAARCLALAALPLPAALALVVGESVTDAPGSHLGWGNWIALAISSGLLLLLAIEATGYAATFAATTFHASPDTTTNLVGAYVLAWPVLAVVGYFYAHPVLGFPAAAGRFMWQVLIWR